MHKRNGLPVASPVRQSDHLVVRVDGSKVNDGEHILTDEEYVFALNGHKTDKKRLSACGVDIGVCTGSKQGSGIIGVENHR